MSEELVREEESAFRTDTYRCGGDGKIEITHISTGIKITEDGMWLRSRVKAYKRMQEKLKECGLDVPNYWQERIDKLKRIN